MALIERSTIPVDGNRHVVCHCLQVTAEAISEAIDVLGSTTVGEVTACTGAGGACTACHCRIQRMLSGEPPTCPLFAVCGDCGCYGSLCQCRAA